MENMHRHMCAVYNEHVIGMWLHLHVGLKLHTILYYQDSIPYVPLSNARFETFWITNFCITEWCKVCNFLHHQVTQGWTFHITKVWTFCITDWHKVWKFLYHQVTQGLKLFVSTRDWITQTFCFTDWHKVWNFVSPSDFVSLSDANFSLHWLTQGLKLLYHQVKQGLKTFCINKWRKVFCITEWCNFCIIKCVTVYTIHNHGQVLVKRLPLKCLPEGFISELSSVSGLYHCWHTNYRCASHLLCSLFYQTGTFHRALSGSRVLLLLVVSWQTSRQLLHAFRVPWPCSVFSPGTLSQGCSDSGSLCPCCWIIDREEYE